MTTAPIRHNTYSVCSGAATEGEETVLAVWRGNLGRAQSLQAKYEWFYRRCPFGFPLIRLLRHVESDAIVGVAAAGPRRMLLCDRPVTAGLLVDMAVTPSHRFLQPAMKLQKSLMADGLAVFDLLYGFPNPKAAAVFTRVGYRRVADLVRYVRVLRSAGYLARFMPRALARAVGPMADLCLRLSSWIRTAPHPHCEWQEQPWASIDAVWRVGRPPDGLATIRDSQFVRWRLAHAPNTRTRFLVASEGRNARPTAWVACEQIDDVMVIRDFWATDGIGRVMAAVLASLAAHARRAGCASMSLEFHGDPKSVSSILRAGFLARGARPVFARYSDAHEDSAATLSWHLTSADEDE